MAAERSLPPMPRTPRPRPALSYRWRRRLVWALAPLGLVAILIGAFYAGGELTQVLEPGYRPEAWPLAIFLGGLAWLALLAVQVLALWLMLYREPDLDLFLTLPLSQSRLFWHKWPLVGGGDLRRRSGR